MLNSAVKRFVLPFSHDKSRETFSSELELAGVYALAELERAKGGGLIIKQPEEKLLFITKLGYPLWLFPGNGSTYVFDGLNNSSHGLDYIEMPSAQAFIDCLEKNSAIRENYFAFLSHNNNYFEQPRRARRFSLEGLIVDPDFKKEFYIYGKEASEATANFENLTLIDPLLEQATISSMLTELNKLQSFFKEDARGLLECLRLVNQTTGQYITEIDYAAEAERDEFNARIKAQEELVNPQITKLHDEHKLRMNTLTKNFEGELENQEKLKAKTLKSIETDEQKIKLYQREAETQAKKKHLVYEKQWKQKSSQTKKELNDLKRELKREEKKIKKLNKQKTEETFKLNAEFDTKTKLAMKPLMDLETARDARMLTFKRETQKLLEIEKPVIKGIRDAIKLNESINSTFQNLSYESQRLDSPELFYIPFYVACYQAGLNKRCFLIPPSTTSEFSITSKLKCAFGKARIKDYFSPRFKEITALVEKVEQREKNDSSSDIQISILGEKNNLLNMSAVRVSIAKGLVYLKGQGWLSERETQDLNSRLASI
jgi:hypothetical protein